jgi:DNA (cytosine-5)-methyltransferase 1
MSISFVHQLNHEELQLERIPFVDLFCGAGGLSVGFEQAGFKSVFANDIDPFAANTYKANHRDATIFTGDVTTLTAGKILESSGIDRVPLVIGGPNCQGVSLRGKRDPNDPKNLAFFHFLRLIKELKPDWFVMENVPGLLHRHNRELVESIFEAFSEIGFRCGGEVLLAADYGVPQLRYRFVLIGNRHGLPIEFPEPTHECFLDLAEDSDLFGSDREALPGWITVSEAIGDLPPLENGGGEEERLYVSTARKRLTNYQQWARGACNTLLNHQVHRSADSNINLIRYIGQGQNWKAIPEEHRPSRFRHVALKDHTTTYGRLSWAMPARTITTYFNNISSGAFTHPEQHRGISVREGARLQSFPDAFRFTGPLSRQYRQVGNAVPPLLAQRVAEQLYCSFVHPQKVARTHVAAVEYSPVQGRMVINRPLKGMRFNLDKYLVRR